MDHCNAPGLMPIEQALDTLLKQTRRVSGNIVLTLLEAHNKVLAEDVIAPINVPPADNSAMDGYALRAQDVDDLNNSLQCVGQSFAGQPYKARLNPGECLRIMTGGVIPQGADSVMMQENTEREGDTVRFTEAVVKGQSVRKAGEDIRTGSTVLPAGTKLGPAQLALLASLGIAEVTCVRRLKVAVMATGDELTPPGQPLGAGAIYESNRYALIAQLQKLDAEIMDLGIVPDNKQALKSALQDAAAQADLVISSGGVSVGEADFVRDVLDEIGSIGFWKVAIKPGKPFAFGHIEQTLFCGLPGNPVSSFVTFEQLVLPLINKLRGCQPAATLTVQANAAETFRKRPGRADYQRAIAFHNAQGELCVKPNGKQGSGIMSSITGANCYVILSPESGNIEPGEQVTVQLFNTP